ncbi:hypothetical protein [Paraglaciecola psychrophila]|jgi:hypothetical protein|uniref:DUF4402 domain-containing protein n=1 Tax=Paraglaciecola psychrophila 170 TaxID=1129794 RepID=K7A6X1_9ALTE|nr:hypothetical protein [Paraglaciecola psychrophila]AGH45407.1 hypothetical protein C427_3298 [Paraglaciecola psychrophila 170]GAC38077.1 hypothetical protein GPSY_2461 [Paraglaciecola psychrophila 170]
MKSLTILKKATPLFLLTAMNSAIATDVLVPINFTTLPVISIVPIQALDFGSVLSLSLADECIMDATDGGSGTTLTAAQEGVDATNTTIFNSTAGAANDVGALTGDCLGGADGQVGIYEITSFADANIVVSVTAGVDTDISFAPTGYVTDQLDETTSGVFSRNTLEIGTDATVNASATLTAFGQAGTSRAIVGGKITNFAPLTAGAPYATDFNLNVVYL